MAKRWVGIDAGYSHITVVVVDEGDKIIAAERAGEPSGDGHDREVALARLSSILIRLQNLRDVPVRLAGYCYPHSGVTEAFKKAGWVVEGYTALNDVVGFYGLSDMKGHAIVAGCGSYSQVVYIDSENNICWPGEDVVSELPEWLLSGKSYAAFITGLIKKSSPEELALLFGDGINAADIINAKTDNRAYLGPMLPGLLGHKEADRFIAGAAENIIKTCGIFRKYIKKTEPPVWFVML